MASERRGQAQLLLGIARLLHAGQCANLPAVAEEARKSRRGNRPGQVKAPSVPFRLGNTRLAGRRPLAPTGGDGAGIGFRRD